MLKNSHIITDKPHGFSNESGFTQLLYNAADAFLMNQEGNSPH